MEGLKRDYFAIIWEYVKIFGCLVAFRDAKFYKSIPNAFNYWVKD